MQITIPANVLYLGPINSSAESKEKRRKKEGKKKIKKDSIDRFDNSNLRFFISLSLSLSYLV